MTRLASAWRLPRVALGVTLGVFGIVGLTGFGLWGSQPALAAPPVELEAGFDFDVAGVEETVPFWIEVRAGFRQPPRFEPTFQLDNLEQVGPPTSRESFHFINGVSTRTLRFTWLLRPLSTGMAAVRGIRVRVEGETFELPTERLRVQEDAPPRRRNRVPSSSPTQGIQPPSRRRPDLPLPPSRPLTSGSVFLQAEIEPPDPYVGQQVLYTLYLYTQADISSIYPRRVPPFHGFWAHEVSLPRQPTTEMLEVDGERYGRVPLLQRILFPRRPGITDIEAAEYDLIAQGRRVGSAGRRSQRPHQLTRQANPLRLIVRELPPAPAGFSGAVGRFRLTARLEPREVAVGDAATLTLTLDGDGHVQSLPAPEPPDLPGVKVYPPEETASDDLDRRRLQGERSWRFVLVPEGTGRWELEDFELPYFDPEAGGYRVARAGVADLVARPAASRSAETPGPGSELHPIRSAVVPTKEGSQLRTRLRSLLPWLATLPLLLTVALRLARRRTTGSPPARKLLDRLADIEAEDVGEGLAANRHAATEIEEAWRTYLVERWEIPPEIPPARWADLLAEKPAPGPAAAERIQQLHEEIHYLRYAPQLSTTDTLRRELLEHSRRLVRRLP